MDRTQTIANVCRAVADDALDEAASLLRRDYPFAPEAVTKRRYGPVESTRVFVRDGFLDRYTGDRLVFPPVLRLLSIVLPRDFPFHPNWKTESFPARWNSACIFH